MKWYLHNAWIFFLPFLYTPNFWGFDGATPVGTLKLMDILLFPFVFLLLITPNKKGKRFYKKTYTWVYYFMFWAFLGLVLIQFKYSYSTLKPLLFSALKFFKFGLYIFTGYLVVKKVDDTNISAFYKALMVIGIVVGFSVYRLNVIGEDVDSFRIFSASNITSVALSILLAAMTPVFLYSKFFNVPKLLVGLSVIAMLTGLVVSGGRGGIIAFVLAMAYLFLRKFNSPRIWLGLAVASALVVFAYFNNDRFQYDVNRTIFPSEQMLRDYAKKNVGIGGLDDGKRLSGVKVELPKLLNNPIIGTGFFHRTWKTGLMPMGSHNFFLQMALETGIIGLLLIIFFFREIWKQASKVERDKLPLALSLKMGLIAAIFGGLGGEYFYAGEALMMLLLVYSTIGLTPYLQKPKTLRLSV